MSLVHVYCARAERAHRSELLRSLSHDDLATAAGIGGTVAREEFLIGRAFLRRVLSLHAECLPRELEFARTSHGKPFLGSAPYVHFNLSHSSGVYLAAVARTEIGVDVERVDQTVDHRGVAQEVFSAGELAFLDAAPPDLRAERFFSIWTLKEAYLKATGAGLGADLKRISTVSRNGAVADASLPKGAPTWFSHELAAGAGFRAAFAIATPCPLVVVHDCSTIRGMAPAKQVQALAALPRGPKRRLLRTRACAEMR